MEWTQIFRGGWGFTLLVQDFTTERQTVTEWSGSLGSVFEGKSRLKLRQSQTIFETGHEKNSFLHMRKQRHRSASG